MYLPTMNPARRSSRSVKRRLIRPFPSLKGRLIAEGFELVSNCYQLKMVSPKDGKKYNTDVADMQQAFRIIQSIPSKKAEPFKQWMAQVAKTARKEVEKRLGHSVISREKAIDNIKSPEELPFPDEQKQG